jgi:hypothetical protein
MICEVVNTPDSYFWYALSITLFLSLIWVLVRYANKIDRTFDKMADNIVRLSETQIILGVKVDGHDEDIREIKSKMDKK